MTDIDHDVKPAKTLEIELGYLSQLFKDAQSPCNCEEIDDPPCWSCESAVIISEMNVKL